VTSTTVQAQVKTRGYRSFPSPRISFIFARQPSLPAAFISELRGTLLGALGLGTILDCCIVSYREHVADWVGPTSSDFPYIIDTIRSVAFIVGF